MLTYEVVGLTYTRRCPLSCADCITESSPTASGKMSFDLALSCVAAIPEFCNNVSFTGGEPLLYHHEIARLIRAATDRGLHAAVVTGAGWVTDECRASKVVEALAKAGLSRITISWDQYHEEHSARWRATMLARAGAENGIDVRVTVVTPAGKCSTAHQEAFADVPVTLQLTRPIRLGAAATLPDDHFHWEPDLPRGSCSAVLKPLIDYDGTVYACCGPSLHSQPSSPLILGHVRQEPLDQILRRGQHDPILEVIALVGPYGLYKLLDDSGLLGSGSYQPPRRFSSVCDLCLDITNRPDLIQAVRERLTDREGRALVAAARMWRESASSHVDAQPA